MSVLTSTSEQILSPESGPILCVAFAGEYPPGSAGNSCAAEMIAYTRSVLAGADASAVLFDLRNLRYVWGDAIGGLALLLQKNVVFRPSAIVASGGTAHALEPLLGSRFLFGVAGTKMFGTISEAVAHLSEAIVQLSEAMAHTPDKGAGDDSQKQEDSQLWRCASETVVFVSSGSIARSSPTPDAPPASDLKLSLFGARLKQAIVERYGRERVRLSDPPDPVVTFNSPHPDVGELAIMDDCDEATIYMGKITHSHFDSVEDVLNFLDDLFDDRVLLWSSKDGTRGGWRIRESQGIELVPNACNYLWSGPILSSDAG